MNETKSLSSDKASTNKQITRFWLNETNKVINPPIKKKNLCETLSNKTEIMDRSTKRLKLKIKKIK